MLSMQRTHGNRPVQRHLQARTPSAPVAVQRFEYPSWARTAYDQVGYYADQVGMGGSLLQGADDALTMAFAGPGMASQAASFGGLTGGLGNVTGGLSLVTGLMQMLDSEASTGERVSGGLSALSGGIGLAGGTFAPGLAAGGASGLAAPVLGAGSAGAFGSAGAAIGSGGAVLGAGLAGWGLGSAISDNTRVGEHTMNAWGRRDRELTRNAQMLGLMDEGENQSAMVSAGEWASENPWKAAGLGLLSAPVSVPLAANAAYDSAIEGIQSATQSAAVDYGGRALRWAGSLF
jgi:hypothetical protein